MPVGLLFGVILARRKRYSVESVQRRKLRDAFDPMDIPEKTFVGHYRLNKLAFKTVLDEVAPFLVKCSIPEAIQVASALRFVAIGTYQGAIANDMYVSMGRTTFCKMLWRVLNNMEDKLCPKWITAEMSADEVKQSKIHFYQKHGIPGVIGCIDGTHVKLIKPTEDESLYYNRKGYFSINVMIICDYKMRIRAVDSSKPGSCHDSFVWDLSNFKEFYSHLHLVGEHRNWLLGDSGYALAPYLMTPYHSAEYGTMQHRFNLRHCSARNIVERTIGTLKSRFRCLLSNLLHYHPAKVGKLSNICCALHNVCRHYNIEWDEELVPPDDDNYEHDDGEINTQARNIRDDIARSLT